MKRLFSFILCITMVFASTSAAHAITEEGFNYTVVDNEAIISRYVGGDIETLIIPSTLGGYTVTGLEAHAFNYSGSVKNIVIPASVTEINDMTFDFCTDLESFTVDSDNPQYCSVDGVIFSKDMTTLVHYPQSKAATSYSVPQGVTKIGGYAFKYAQKLESISFAQGVTTFGGYAFYSCSQLTRFDIPDGVTHIGERCFRFSGNIITITIPASVESIGESAFSGATSLENIEVAQESLHYADLDGILYTRDITGLIAIPAKNACENYVSPNTVTLIAPDAASNNNKLQSVAIGDSVQSIGNNAFYYCQSLEKVAIGDGVTTIGQFAFTHCSELRELSLGKNIDTIHAYAFYECYLLKDIVVPDSVIYVGVCAFGACTGIERITFGRSLEWLGYQALIRTTALESVTFLGAPPNIDREVFNEQHGENLTIYYSREFKDEWTGNGETSWQGFPLMQQIIRGDANFDGAVDSSDAARILRWVVKLEKDENIDLMNANVNYDTEVTAADAAKILRFIVKIEESL